MRIFRELGSFILVGLTGMLITYVLVSVTLPLLVPWDAAAARPDIGTWQRTINDFFSGHIGSILIILLATIMVASPIFRTLYNCKNQILNVCMSNLLFFVASYFFVISSMYLSRSLVSTSNDVLDPRHHSYFYSILPLFTLSILYVVWLRRILTFGNFNNNKNGVLHSPSVN